MERAPVPRSERAADNEFEPRLGFRPFSSSDAECSIAMRFRAIALKHADSIALAEGSERLTYRQLLAQSANIAEGLRTRLGSTPGTVGVFLSFGAQAVPAILGALLGGASYFPMETSLPDAQLDELLMELEVDGVIVDQASRRRLGIACPGFAGQLFEISSLLGESGAEPFLDNNSPGSIAALYATSGSTGKPKLVALSHRAILFDIGRQTNDLYLGPDDRFDLLSSFAFSASLAPMFGALLNGAELHLLDLNESLAELADWLEQRRITISTMTVSMLRSVCLATRKSGACPDLRLLSVSGEPLLGSDIEAFRNVFAPSCVLQNAMAATETRTYAQYFVPRSGPVAAAAPVGWPVNGKQVVLLDEHGSSVHEGEEGEIAIRSRYLASGYANDAALTAQAFMPRDDGTVLYRTGDYGRFSSDGSLLFLGRRDRRVKVRGYRVELGAIEAALQKLPSVQQSVVEAREDVHGEVRIVAHVVPKAGAAVTAEQLRSVIRGALPEYMVPSELAVLDALPLTANRKVDRARLPAITSDSTVAALLRIWSEVLGKPCVSPQENFYDLGGESLSALRLLVLIQERFRCDLPAASIREHPTVEQLARVIDRAVEEKAARRRLLIFNAGGSRAPIFFVHPIGGSAEGYKRLALNLGADQPSYGLSARTWEAVDPQLSIASLASEYIDEIGAAVEPGQRLVLAGYSLGATIAFEMARQLAGAGEPPPLVVIIDMPATNVPGKSHRSWPRTALDVLANLPSWFVHVALRSNPKRLLRRVEGRIGMALAREPSFSPKFYFGVAELPASYHAFLSAMYHALVRYAPGEYLGDVVLLRSRIPTLFRAHDPQMGWQFVAPRGVEVLPVPGSHFSCVLEPHVLTMAAVLRERLERT